MAELTFKETKQRNGFRTGVKHWMIRVPSDWTNDGFVTIGKVAPARNTRAGIAPPGRPEGRYTPEGWCLQLNSDTDLTWDELEQVKSFIGLQMYNEHRDRCWGPGAWEAIQ